MNTVAVLISEQTAENRRINRAKFEALPPFNLDQALAGALYTNYYGVTRDRSYCDIRPLPDPNGGFLVWVGEWTVYQHDEQDQLYADLRMVPPTFGGIHVEQI